MTLRRVRLRDVDMAARWRSRSAPLALALLSSSSREAHEEFGGQRRRNPEEHAEVLEMDGAMDLIFF